MANCAPGVAQSNAVLLAQLTVEMRQFQVLIPPDFSSSSDTLTAHLDITGA
jgi:hypothetical protein